MDRFFLETRLRLLGFRVSELAQLLFALGVKRNQVEPPRQWLNQLLLATYLKMEFFGPKVCVAQSGVEVWP